MIENPEPENWRLLQSGVCRLFNDIDLAANTDKKIPTPRGIVEVDVFAIDENSTENIRYIVECKNWEASIPQSVVHSFTTVMEETGANLGFLVSRHGLQSGAKEYTNNTNIIGLTFKELQQKYLKIWWNRFYCKKLIDVADSSVKYIEPINSYRDKVLSNLSENQKKNFRNLQAKYSSFIIYVNSISMSNLYTNDLTEEIPTDIELYKENLRDLIGNPNYFKSIYYRDLLFEICEVLNEIEKEFNQVFGENIFKYRT